MSSRVYLFFPSRGHEPPPTLRDCLNPHLSLSSRHFSVPRYTKRLDVALDAIGPFFLLPTPSSPYCTLKVSENDSLRQPPAAHSEGRPRPQSFSRSQLRLNALTPGYLKGTVVRSHPMVWSLALCPDDTNQDLVGYGAEFGVVFLAKGPRTASIQGGLDCLRLNHSGFEGERDFRLVVELP